MNNSNFSDSYRINFPLSDLSTHVGSKKQVTNLIKAIEICDKKIKELGPNSISEKQISEMRELKKITKQTINQLENKSIFGNFLSIFYGESQLTNLKAKYNIFSAEYDSLILNNPILQHARNISHLIRQTILESSHINNSSQELENATKINFSVLCKKYEIFEPSLKELSAPKSSETSLGKNNFRLKLINASQEIEASNALKRKNIKWLHGTRSPAMQVMLATDKSLYPTGVLLEHKIIPLTGELSMGIIPGMGVNNTNLSGTTLSRIGIKTTIEYSQEFKANTREEWRYLSKGKLEGIIERVLNVLKVDPELKSDFAPGVKFHFLKAGIYINRLKVIDPEFESKISEFKENVVFLKEKYREYPEIISLLIPLISECDTPPFIEPTPEIRLSVSDSFPIILASTSVEGNPHFQDLDEHIVSGAVSLENIQIAFTESNYVERLKKTIKESGLNIEVLSFDALKLLSVEAPDIGKGFL